MPTLKEADLIDLDDLFGVVLNNVGVAAFFAENYVVAKPIFEAAIDWAVRYRNPDAEGIYRGNFAALLVMDGDFLSALAGAHSEAFDSLTLADATARSVLRRALTAVAGVSLSLRAEIPELDVIEFLQRFLLLNSKFGIVWPLTFLSERDRTTALEKFRDAGADAEQHKRLEELFTLIPAIMPDAAEMVVLSTREQTVLQNLAIVESREELAKRLFVSANTIKTQLSSIYSKLGVSNRTEALAKAMSLRMLVSREQDRDQTAL